MHCLYHISKLYNLKSHETSQNHLNVLTLNFILQVMCHLDGRLSYKTKNESANIYPKVLQETRPLYAVFSSESICEEMPPWGMLMATGPALPSLQHDPQNVKGFLAWTVFSTMDPSEGQSESSWKTCLNQYVPFERKQWKGCHSDTFDCLRTRDSIYSCWKLKLYESKHYSRKWVSKYVQARHIWDGVMAVVLLHAGICFWNKCLTSQRSLLRQSASQAKVLVYPSERIVNRRPVFLPVCKGRKMIKHTPGLIIVPRHQQATT